MKGSITPPPVFAEKAQDRAVEPTTTPASEQHNPPESPGPAAELKLILEPYPRVRRRWWHRRRG